MKTITFTYGNEWHAWRNCTVENLRFLGNDPAIELTLDNEVFPYLLVYMYETGYMTWKMYSSNRAAVSAQRKLHVSECIKTSFIYHWN